MANDHGEMARERTYFKQISLFYARCIYVAHKTSARLDPAAVCICRLDAFGEDSPLLSKGGVSNLKGLKRFPRRVARRIVGPRTPIDRRDSLALSCSLPRALSRSPSRLIPFRLLLAFFSPCSACNLLRTFKRTMSPYPKNDCPFRREKFRAT